jgi:hypothetical protein
MAEVHDNIYVYTVSTVFFCQAFQFTSHLNILQISFSKPCIMQSVTAYKIKMLAVTTHIETNVVTANIFILYAVTDCIIHGLLKEICKIFKCDEY